ncbi:sialate O-acetylesterase [Fibrella aquatica]|uniref:sialate O-acetylesterase n=1 Tax=Fibrella aquatica TaxID=3242487 RepID=UPI003522683C
MILLRFSAFLCLLLSIGRPALAQLTIQFPASRFVAQRGLDNQGRLYIAARISQAADRVEAQLTPVVTGQGVASSWQTIQINPQPGGVMGYVTGAGGWYVLTVRAIQNGVVVSQASVQPVGIGEVFILAGQSNSRGFGIGDNDLGATSDRVSSIDTINHYYPTNFPALLSSGDPMPFPTYSPLTAGKRVFPMGESSWGWGELGDYIVNRFNVPVMFYNAGWDAATVDNWNDPAKGIPACNLFYCVVNWPNLQPYTNLKQIMSYYGATGGFRAVLWHQGESENVRPSTIPLYAARLDSLIRKVRQDFNNRSMPWVIARASFTGQVTNADVVAQQEKVIQTPNFSVFRGPLNDTILNRLGGQPDVHFGNALRPAVHPRYYLNPQSIPANMGLSRFARNWNNSLTDSFFQTAAPVLPVLFASTNEVTAARGGAFSPGDSVLVTFNQSGTFNADNRWDVQILDAKGRFRANVGRGSVSPIRVKWPDSLAIGTYRVRVVSTSPVMASAPTPVFSLRAKADVSISSAARRRVLAVNDTTTVYITVANAGPAEAVGIVWQCRLPTNVIATALAGTVTVTNGIVSGTLPALAAGQQLTRAFRIQVTVNGTYSLASEIKESGNNDPDSQPGSGTGDGQDDATHLDLRVGTGQDTYVSPNPDQVPLPTVVGNQPTPVANMADLSLRLVVSNRTPALNELVTYSLIVTNRGGAEASNINTTAYLPAGMQFVDSNDMGPGGGGITGTTLTLPAGASSTRSFRARATTIGPKQTQAQVRVANPADPDSTPGNGYPISTGEDDEATVDLRVQ